MNDAQAGRVSAGTVERSGPQVPRAMRRARCGRRPSRAHGARRRQVAPSSPMMRSCVAMRRGRAYLPACPRRRNAAALDRLRPAPYGCAALPSVSVIVPTYNCAAFLEESLGSVLPQVPADSEVVVVDDGSTDDTGAVLARYGERIRVVHIPHGGLA